eukprot:1713236-Heterocapsa_arctica.AAC.1
MPVASLAQECDQTASRHTRHPKTSRQRFQLDFAPEFKTSRRPAQSHHNCQTVTQVISRKRFGEA